jgi:hypothetical protein
LSGCGITGVFFCAACLRRNSSERPPLVGREAWRSDVVDVRRGSARAWGRRRSGPRGSRKRGMEWRDAIVVDKSTTLDSATAETDWTGARRS